MPDEIALTTEEEALIRGIRERKAEIERLSVLSDTERAEWEAEHPGEFYAALNIEGSAGGQAYSKCAEAMSQAALAAFELVARDLGVTGWQASYAELDFLRRSRRIEGPWGIYQMHDALYPQYDVVGRIEKARWSDDTVRWLGDQAEKRLTEERHAADTVIAHWHSLVAQRDALPAAEVSGD